MQRIILVLALLSLPLARARADVGLPKETLSKIKRATVLVKSKVGDLSLSCTGIVIKAEGRTGYVITSGEIVQLSRPAPTAPPQLSLVLDSGTDKQRTIRGEVASIGGLPENLAVIKFKVTGEIPTTIDLHQHVAPAETMPVHVFGFPFGRVLATRRKGDPEVTITRGSVSRLVKGGDGEVRAIQLDGSLNPGHIGSPIVDAQGRLVGVALGSIRGSRIAAAVPARPLARSLRPRVGQISFKPIKVGERTVDFQLEVPLIDPLGELQSVYLMTLDSRDRRRFPARNPDGTYSALESGRRVEMKIQGKEAVGFLTVDKTKMEDQAIGMHQVCQIDGQGTVFSVPTGFRYSELMPLIPRGNAVAAAPPRAATPPRAKRGNPARASGGILDELRRYSGHGGAVTDLAVAKDGRHVVSSSLDQTIRFWDLDSGQAARILKGHEGPVFCVDISPDAKSAVSGGADRTVRIWDLATGEELHRLTGHEAGVLDVAFSPDG
jgi:hypothetical protein